MGEKPTQVEMRVLSLLCAIITVSGHEYYPGQCPNFTPMAGFDWDRFSNGVWYVTQKFNTKSTCLTYEFETDNLGFKSIKQDRKLPFSDQVGVDNTYIYKGKLYAPSESSPAKMIVRFPLNVIGSSSFVVMDTDYDSFALVCTCQDVDVYLTYVNRRSCSILQRTQEEDEQVTEDMKAILDSDVKDEDSEEASHDFEKIRHENCNYGKDKAITIDVDKILGIGGGKGNTEVREAVESVSTEFEFNNKPLNEIREEAENGQI